MSSRSKTMEKYWVEIRKIVDEKNVTYSKARSIYSKRNSKNLCYFVVDEETSIVCPYCKDDFQVGESYHPCCGALYHISCFEEFKKCALCGKKKKKKKKKKDKISLSKKKIKIDIASSIGSVEVKATTQPSILEAGDSFSLDEEVVESLEILEVGDSLEVREPLEVGDSLEIYPLRTIALEFLAIFMIPVLVYLFSFFIAYSIA